MRGEGSGDSASGLDPAYLLPGGHVLAAFHALAHPSQVARLAALSPQAAARTAVVGDPTLERILASATHRDRYRAALGTGARKLIVITSTWGPESIMARRPTLPATLVASLPHDAYQLALVVHPNERNRISEFNLAENQAPAIHAGMVLAEPYEEWAAVLVAADAVITDHGSTALYAAALDCPLIAAYDGGEELIPGSPMDHLLACCPRLDDPGGIEAALGVHHHPGAVRALAEAAFAEQGRALERLRAELYGLLDLDLPADPVIPRPLPPPAAPARAPAAFAVRTRVNGGEVRVERFPVGSDLPAHHMAAEYGKSGGWHLQSSGLLYCRAGQPALAAHSVTWTAAGWTDHILDNYPGCRTAAVVVSASRCLARTRSGALLLVSIEPCHENGRVVRTDPAAVLSGVHAWLGAHPGLPAVVNCVIGGRSFRSRLSPASADDAALEI